MNTSVITDQRPIFVLFSPITHEPKFVGRLPKINVDCVIIRQILSKPYETIFKFDLAAGTLKSLT